MATTEGKPQIRLRKWLPINLREIRAVQPKGPYFIGGHSFGGIVAFEMAQQLHRQGQSVGLLVLLDPTTPSGVDSIVATVPQNPSSKSKDCRTGLFIVCRA